MVIMSIKNIDKIFRKGLRYNDATAPDFIWGQLSNTLESRRRNNRRLWFAAASVVLLLGVGGAWMSIDKGPQQQMAGGSQSDSLPAVHAAEMLEAPSFADSAIYINDNGAEISDGNE